MRVDQRALAGKIERQRAGWPRCRRSLILASSKASVRRAQLSWPLMAAALSPSAVATGTPNQRAARRRLGVDRLTSGRRAAGPRRRRGGRRSSPPAESPFKRDFIGQPRGVALVGGAEQRGIEGQPLAAHREAAAAGDLALAASGQLGLDVADRLRRCRPAPVTCSVPRRMVSVSKLQADEMVDQGTEHAMVADGQAGLAAPARSRRPEALR